VGLTETTVEAMLNRVAAGIEDAAGSVARHPATVHFSVAELDSGLSPEELLGEDGDEFAARAHRRTKTVMLAD
jgi:hypothetical protein